MTFVGSGDAFGSGGRLQACIMVDDGETRVLLDCGAASLIGLKRLGIESNSITSVIISHLHGDHFGGVPFLVLDGQFSGREQPLFVDGPRGTRARLKKAMEALFPGSSKIKRRFPLVVTEMSAGVEYSSSNGTTATAFLGQHASGAPAHILRFEWHGKTIAYSGDSAWAPELVEASRGAELFVCEAYFRDKRVPYHLSYAELEEHAQEFDCRRIILTHMTPEMIEAEGLRFERAHDGLVVSV